MPGKTRKNALQRAEKWVRELYWVQWLKWHAGRHRTPVRQAQWRFRQVCHRLGPDDTVIDCGANLGEVTARLARRGARVHAFEPDPYCFGRLQDRFGSRPNIVLHNAAVGAAGGTVRLYRSRFFAEDNALWSQSTSQYATKNNVDPSAHFDATVVDLATFVGALDGRVALLKIDIEGAEVAVLNRLIDDGLMDRIDAVFVETHERKIPELAEPTAALRQRIADLGLARVSLDWV